MKIIHFEDERSWLDARLGRITGTRLKDILPSRNSEKPKIGFYELIAERIAVPAGLEAAIDRGKRLEDEAIERFEKETKKKVDTSLVLWCRDDNEQIAISPDGSIGKTEAVEAKCLSSAHHLEAWMTKDIPREYEYQVIQYFLVNEQLKKLHVAFYDPRLPKIEFFYLTVERKAVQEKVAECLEIERSVLAEIEKVEKDLTF